MVWLLIIQSIYFFLPAYFANMAPVIFKKNFLFLTKPIDMGKTHRKRRIFGDNKTWKGLLIGTVVGLLTAMVQALISIYPFFEKISLIKYNSYGVFWVMLFGTLLGCGALVGDMIESYFKRQLNIKPGKPWFPFDQLDFVIFGLLFSFILYFPGWRVVLIIILASPILHVLTRLTGYALKIDKSKF